MKTSRRKIVPVGRSLCLGTAVALIWIPLAIGAFAQEPAQESERAVTMPVVPQQVRYAGKLVARAGQTVAAEFRIYSAQEGGEPLWTETQQFPVGADGSYSVLLGSATAAGLPQTVFAGGAARWLAVSVERAPESERVLLSSVPYAMKSADAESLAGHAASDFVTQEQLAALGANSVEAGQLQRVGAPGTGFQPLTSGPISGSGTTGNVAVFTGANTIGNSDIVQVGNDVGINVTTPAALLDVGGTATVRGTLDLPPLATATTTSGYNSNSLELGSSAWSTTAAGPVTQNFFLENLATGNNTASPGAKIDLLFASGSGNPAATGLSFGSNGLINFAAGQTFPGASTITTITTASPLTGGGSSGPLTLSLSLPTLEASLDSVYPQLATGNTFKASQSITGSLTTSVAVNTSALNTTTASIEGLTTAIGGINVGNSVQMHQINSATSTTPYNSPYFQFIGSAFNSSTAAAQNETFAWQTVVTGNNTASPSAYLQLLSGSGSNQSATGLTISPSGVINFVPAQTFPGGSSGGGTITGITTSSPLTGSGTTGSVALGFNTSALEGTLDMVYPQLGVSNIFTGTQTINSGGLNVGGALISNSVLTGASSSSGGYISNGLVNLTPSTTATAASTSDSPLLEIGGSAYSSSMSEAVPQNFAWQTVDSGNNTASPTANLELLFGAGATTPAATGLSIAPNGTINFASGQTFPGTGTGNGTITGITTASPLTGSGTSGSVGLGLNTSALETTLNSVYAQLGAANTFTAPITFAAGQTFPGTIASVGASSPLTASTTNGAVSLGLNTSSLESTLNGVYPTLAGNNTFAGTATFSKAVTFNAAGQSFPNTVSSLTATSPLMASTSTGVVTVSLNTSALATTLNSDYAQLAASNTFSGASNTFNGPITAAGSLTAEGYSETDNAVIATGTNGAYGVAASSDSGIAVLGDAGTSAMDSIPGKAGVFGLNFQGSSNSLQSLDNGFYAGVWGDTSGPTGSAGIRPVGVIGTADDNFAGYFLNGGPYYPALYAESTSGTNGILAKSDATGDGQSGVLGIGNTLSITYSTYTDGSEVYAAGVWGDNGNSTTTTSPLWNAGVIGTSDDARAGAFVNNSSKYAALYAFDQNTGISGTLFTTFMAGSPKGSCGVGSSGDMSCTGRVKSLVSVGDGARKVETYSVQSPESWMEDFGAGELQNGVALVKLDPAFAETISADASYHVFITPNGDSESLYVIRKTATSFEVRESKGGTSSLTFDYRIVAKRRGYEGERLTDVTERFKTENALAMPPKTNGAAHNPRPAEYSPDKIGRPGTASQSPRRDPVVKRMGASAQAPVHE